VPVPVPVRDPSTETVCRKLFQVAKV
jgi:hypothetical protein